MLAFWHDLNRQEKHINIRDCWPKWQIFLQLKGDHFSVAECYALLPRRWKAVANFFNLWPDLPMHGSCPARAAKAWDPWPTVPSRFHGSCPGCDVDSGGHNFLQRSNMWMMVSHLQRRDFFSRCENQGPVGSWEALKTGLFDFRVRMI